MESSLKRRDLMQQQAPHPDSDVENNSSSSGDRLISPCKRLRLHDTPDKAATFADQINDQADQDGNTCETPLLGSPKNTPEKPRPGENIPEKPRPGENTHEKPAVPACVDTPDKPLCPSQTLQEKPEFPDNVPEQSSAAVAEETCVRDECCSRPETPQDEGLIHTPEESFTCREEGPEADSPALGTPQHRIPHNTPERSGIPDDDDDEEEEDGFIINRIATDWSDTMKLPLGNSITFADITNLHGIRCEGETKPAADLCPSERSVTFADQTNANGAERRCDVSQQQPYPGAQESLTEYENTYPKYSHHLPARQEKKPHVPRFNSAENLLCPEELDHHRLSLQSYGSLAPFGNLQHQRPRVCSSGSYFDYDETPITGGPVFRGQNHHGRFTSSGRQNVPFRPQNLDLRFSRSQQLADPGQGRLVDYGNVDGPLATRHFGNLDQNGLVDYGSVDDPVSRGYEYKDLGPRGHYDPESEGSRDTHRGARQGRLWYYGSIDDPQRLTNPPQSVCSTAQTWQPIHGRQHHFVGSLEGQGSLTRQKSEQTFVRSASRRTLPRLCSQGNEKRLGCLGSHGNIYRHNSYESVETLGHSGNHEGSADQTPQQEADWVGYSSSSSHHANDTGSKTSRGSLCVLSSSSSQGDLQQNHSQESSTGGTAVHPGTENHPHRPLHPEVAGLSGSSGSHSELISQSSAGKSGSSRHGDSVGEQQLTASESQGSVDSLGRSAGSQRSVDSRGNSYGTLRTEAVDPVLADAHKKRKVLETPGQLKVSTYLNCGLVTVHVIEGRSFACTWKPVCDSYIKLSLIPEEGGRKLRLKSKPVVSTNNPVFEEKFSLELQKSDESKRLLVSIWHKDLHSGCSEFMGCMSFGVRGILRNKEVNGWYYLLTEEVGKKKHLEVTSRSKGSLKLRAHNIPRINRDVLGLEAVTIQIDRGKNGFGFSVVDEFPVRVGRVDLASPAEEAGLKPGDFVIKVNNQNVSRSTVNSVAKLVKKSGQTLLLNVNRPHLPSLEIQGVPELSEFSEHSEPSLWKRPDHIYESIPEETVADGTSLITDNENKENEISMASHFEISSVCEPFTQGKLSASTPLPSRDGKLVLMAPASSALDQRKLEAIHRLMSLELDFIDFMQLGIKRYLRPLRHCIFNIVQHNTVFQNVEKLVNISEYHVQQLQENAPSIYPESDDDSQSSEDRHFSSAVAMIYYSKVHMFCQAHETYAEGLSEANRVLSDMRQNEEFLRFIKEPPLEPGQPSISAFIFRPLQHIKELSTVFQDIFVNTPNSSNDHTTLKQVTHVLQESVHAISNMSNARVQSLTSLTSYTRSSSSGKGSCTVSSAASSKDSGSESGRVKKTKEGLKSSTSLQTVRAVDREVMKLQDKLVFSENVPVFQLCHEDRHIIYQGELFFLQNKNWSKIEMVLLSDLLLLYQPDKEGSLHVVCDPVLLRDICNIETHKKHTTELVLRICPTSPCTGIPTTLRLDFRTPTPEDLSTWKNLLEHRVKSAHGNAAFDSPCPDAQSATSSVQ